MRHNEYKCGEVYVKSCFSIKLLERKYIVACSARSTGSIKNKITAYYFYGSLFYYINMVRALVTWHGAMEAEVHNVRPRQLSEFMKKNPDFN